MQATTFMFAETKKPRKASVRTMEPLLPERLLLAGWGEEFVLLRGVQALTYCWKRCRHIFHKNKKRTSLELHLLISGKVLFRLETAESNMSFRFFQLRNRMCRIQCLSWRRPLGVISATDVRTEGWIIQAMITKCLLLCTWATEGGACLSWDGLKSRLQETLRLLQAPCWWRWVQGHRDRREQDRRTQLSSKVPVKLQHLL